MSGTLPSAPWAVWTALTVPVTLPSHSKAGFLPTVPMRHCSQSRVRPGHPALLTPRPMQGHPGPLISPPKCPYLSPLFRLGPTQINQVVSHPNQPLTITAHDDRGIRFLDNRTGEAQPSLLPDSPVPVGGGGAPGSHAESWCPCWRL